ncbi:MAG TPA: ABC transporter permease [bacterium]|nr:ABC transporter permease [bacterium]
MAVTSGALRPPEAGGRIPPTRVRRGTLAAIGLAFARNRLALASALVFAAIGVAALLAVRLAPYPYALQDLDRRLEAPSAAHLLGTDAFGRDVLSRIVVGARASLATGIVATGVALAVGTLIGIAGGYFLGTTDLWLTRLTELALGIPPLFLVLLIIALFGPSLRNTILVIGLVYWPPTARIIRGEALRLRQHQFIEAAQALGASAARTLWRHVFPNLLPAVIVQATLFMADAILIESGLSYLGVGIQPPLPSWGNMLVDGRRYVDSAWWIATFPGTAIFVTVLSINLAGDGLRDALDPRRS